MRWPSVWSLLSKPCFRSAIPRVEGMPAQPLLARVTQVWGSYRENFQEGARACLAVHRMAEVQSDWPLPGTGCPGLASSGGGGASPLGGRACMGPVIRLLRCLWGRSPRGTGHLGAGRLRMTCDRGGVRGAALRAWSYLHHWAPQGRGVLACLAPARTKADFLFKKIRRGQKPSPSSPRCPRRAACAEQGRAESDSAGSGRTM